MSHLLDLWLDYLAIMSAPAYMAAFGLIMAGVYQLTERNNFPLAMGRFKRAAGACLVGSACLMGSFSVRAWYADHQCHPRPVCPVGERGAQ